MREPSHRLERAYGSQEPIWNGKNGLWSACMHNQKRETNTIQGKLRNIMLIKYQ